MNDRNWKCKLCWFSLRQSHIYIHNVKAVGSGKSGKAALPDFPPSVQFILTHVRLGEQIDALKGTCATIRT